MDLSEKQTQNTFIKPTTRSNTIVIDNGTYELKAGYLGNLSIIAKNKIFKNKDKISLEPFPSATVKTMFDDDVITGFDTLEYTIDQVLTFLNPEKLENLIFTDTPNSPTHPDLIEFLFEVYDFQKIQIGQDSIYTYHKYFDGQDCVVIDFKYSCLMVTVIKDQKIKDLIKINFGGKDMLEYINYYMIERYKETRKDYKGLVEYIRVSENYSKESVEIYNEICNGNYKNNMFLSESSAPKVEPIVKRNKKNTSNPISIPIIDYLLMNTPDESLNKDQLKEKRRFKLIFCSTHARIKQKIENLFLDFDNFILNQKDDLEKLTNFKNYLIKKKVKFSNLKRKLELREQTRKNSKNRKTREFQVKNKEGVLTEEEQQIKIRLLEAEDEEMENSLISEIDKLAYEIIELDADFIPFYANTVEILRGDNLARKCVNIELIKFPEIVFDPSIIGSEQMGLSEIFEKIFTVNQIENVLICGGFSFIKNFENRVKNEIKSFLKSGNANVITAKDSQKDPFYGARYSDLLPTYTRESYQQVGLNQMIEDAKIKKY
jgi:actin-related protein 5